MQASSIRWDRDVQLAIDALAEAEPITALGDSACFGLEITGGRLVSGFGGAINLTARTRPPSLPSARQRRPISRRTER